MWNTYLRYGGGGMICGVLVTSFVSEPGSKLRLNEGYVGGNVVGLSGG